MLIKIIRKIVLFVLGLLAPTELSFPLERIILHGDAVGACLWLLFFGTLWAITRPSYAAASVALFWTALVYIYLAPLTLETGAGGIVSRREAMSYELWFAATGITALTFGVYTAVAGAAHSWRRVRAEAPEEPSRFSKYLRR